MKNALELEWRHVYVWLGISACVGIFFLADIFPSARSRIADIFLPTFVPSADILLVKIDDASLNKIGQWPWPRAVFADFLRKIDGARVVGIDVGFREPSRLGEADDAALADAIARSRPAVVLPFISGGPGERAGPIPLFEPFVVQGFASAPADADGVLRRMSVWQDNEPSFAYAVALVAERGKSLESFPDEARIAYRGSNGTYPSVPFISVLQGLGTPQVFADKIVLVGVTASDLQNFHRTPFGFMSGIEVQANVVDSIISGAYYRESRAATIGVIVLLSFLTIVIIAHVQRLLPMLALLLLLAAAYVLAVILGLAYFFVFDILYPLIAVIATALVGSASQYLSTLRRERAVRESFTYLASMIGSIHDGILMVDASLNVRVVNTAARKILATSDDKDALAKCADALSEKLDVMQAVRASIRSGSVGTAEDVLVNDRFYAVIVAPVQSGADARDETLGSVVIFHDTTHQKEIERIRQDFISMMVHDLRAPLDAIKKLASVLLEEKQVERRETYTHMMGDNAGRMLDLVNDLLDLAKIEAGKFTVQLEAVDMRALIEDRIAFFSQSAASAGVSLKSCVAKDVPPSFFADERYAARALNNAVSNALKFTPKDGSVTVHAFMHAGGDVLAHGTAACGLPTYESSHVVIDKDIRDGLVLAIADTGSGIPKEKLSTLFNKFAQLHSKSPQGTGLGLAIIKGIVEAHGGAITIASSVGKGTAVYLVFPTASAVAASR